MVRIKSTRETTRNGKRGTVFEIGVISLSETEARGRARGAMLTRFPGAVGQLETLSSKETDSKYPGVDEFDVEIFVPHINRI